MLRLQQVGEPFEALVLADGDELHLGRNDALAGVMHLGDIHARPGAQRTALQVEAQAGEFGVGLAGAAVVGRESGQRFVVLALGDPAGAQGRQAGADVDPGGRFGIGAGAVLDGDGRVVAGLRDLAHGHADVRPAAGDVNFLRSGEGGDGRLVHVGAGGDEFIVGIHIVGGAPRGCLPKLLETPAECNPKANTAKVLPVVTVMTGTL